MYAKIFAQIYDGTLCTKGPWQALVTFQQMLILSDKFGVVDITREAISRRTTIPLEIINVGISALEQEDSDSRNPADNGRRIARLADHRDWGWQIVNYEKFAKLRSAEERREYQREFKRKVRAKDKMSTHVNNVNTADTNVHMSTPQLNSTQKPIGQTKSRLAAAPAGFAEFWIAYPRKEAKQSAATAWRRLDPDADTQIAIAKGLLSARNSDQWRKDGGKFIPHAATWLNGKRWQDSTTIETQPENRMGKFVI